MQSNILTQAFEFWKGNLTNFSLKLYCNPPSPFCSLNQTNRLICFHDYDFFSFAGPILQPVDQGQTRKGRITMAS